jgi:hypothetical protein
MSTANNRLEIVGIGEDSVTFRLFQNDTDYNPVSQKGEKDIEGRKSTRQTNINRLDHIKDICITMEDDEGYQVERWITRKTKDLRNGLRLPQNTSDFGEFSVNDYNVWTNLERDTQMESGIVLTQADCPDEIVHSYPNIIDCRFGGFKYQAVDGSRGPDAENGTEFAGDNSVSHSSSPFVRFLSGKPMIKDSYELKTSKKATPTAPLGSGIVYFMISSGSPKEINHNLAYKNKGVIKTNVLYKNVKVEVNYNKGKETYGGTTGIPLETAMAVDHKLAVERRILKCLTTGGDFEEDGIKTLHSEVVTAIKSGQSSHYDALALYVVPDLAKNVVFISRQSVTLGEPVIETGLKRIQYQSPEQIAQGVAQVVVEDATEVVIPLLGVMGNMTGSGGEKHLFDYNLNAEKIASKTHLRMSIKAQADSNRGNIIAKSELLEVPLKPENRMENTFYISGDNLVLIPAANLRKQKDLDISVYVEVTEEDASDTQDALGNPICWREAVQGDAMPGKQTLRNTMRAFEVADIHDAPGTSIILRNMSGWEASSGDTTRRVMTGDAKAILERNRNNTIVAGKLLASGDVQSGVKEKLTLSGELNADDEGDNLIKLFSTTRVDFHKPNADDGAQVYNGGNMKDSELGFSPDKEHEQSPVRTTNIAVDTLYALNLPVNWKHTEPEIRLTDQGEVTTTVNRKTVVVPGKEYRRARSSDGFRVKLTKKEATPDGESKPTHYLVLWNAQTRSEYVSMFENDSLKHLDANELLGKWSSNTVGVGESRKYAVMPIGVAVARDDFYTECNIDIDREDHGKSFTILACYGRKEADGEMVWGAMGELNRAYDISTGNVVGPQVAATNFFDNVGPQLYIDEDVLAKQINVKLSNVVSASELQSFHDDDRLVYDTCAIEVVTTCMNKLALGNLERGINTLIGITRRPTRAGNDGAVDMKNDTMRQWIENVRIYVRKCLSPFIPDEARENWIDPTFCGGLTEGGHKVVEGVHQKVNDLTMMQVQTVQSGDLQNQHFKEMSVLGVFFSSTSALTNKSKLTLQEFDAVINAVSSKVGSTLIFKMLDRLLKLKTIIEKNPELTDPVKNSPIQKPGNCPLNIKTILDDLSNFFMAREQIKKLHMFLECADEDDSQAAADAGLRFCSSRSGTGKGSALNDVILDMETIQLDTVTIDFDGINNRKLIPRKIADDTTDQKFLQISLAEFALSGRAFGLHKYHNDIYKGGFEQQQEVGSKELLHAALGGGEIRGIADPEGANDSSVFLTIDERRKVGEFFFRPDVSDPFFIQTIALGSSTTSNEADFKLENPYAGVRATEYSAAGQSLSTTGSPKLEASIVMMDYGATAVDSHVDFKTELGKVVDSQSTSQQYAQHGQAFRMAAYFDLEKKFQLREKLSTVLHVTSQGFNNKTALAFNIPAAVKARAYPQAAAGAEVQKKKNAAAGLTYEFVGLIDADFDGAYQIKTDPEANTILLSDAAVFTGLSQKVLGPIESSKGEYQPAELPTFLSTDAGDKLKVKAKAGFTTYDWGVVSFEKYGTALDAVYDKNAADSNQPAEWKKISDIEHDQRTEPGFPDKIASYGAVPYIGAYELSNRRAVFRPWNLSNISLGDVNVEKLPGDKNEARLAISVVESEANRKLNGTTTGEFGNPPQTPYTLDIDHNQMLSVYVQVRAYREDPAARNMNGTTTVWSEKILLKPPTHTKDKEGDKATNKYIMDTVLFGATNSEVTKGWDSSGDGSFTNGAGKDLTAYLKYNELIEFRFQQHANVAVAGPPDSSTTFEPLTDGTGADIAMGALGEDVPVGDPKIVQIVYNNFSKLINGQAWSADLKDRAENERRTFDRVNTPNFFRLASEDLYMLGSTKTEDRMIAPGPSLVNLMHTFSGNPVKSVRDDKIAEWAEISYRDIGVSLEIQALVPTAETSSGIASSKEWKTLDRINNLKLVPKIAKNVEDIIRGEGSEFIYTTVLPGDTSVDGSGAAEGEVAKADSTAFNLALTYDHPQTSADDSDLSDSAIKNSWILLETDGTKWRQNKFTDTSKYIREVQSVTLADQPKNIRVVLKLNTAQKPRSQLTLSSKEKLDIRRFSAIYDDNNEITITDAIFEPRSTQVPLDESNQLLTRPRITVGADTGGRILEIPIKLTNDSVSQMNIMIAHSTDHETFFNDLRTEGAVNRAFFAKEDGADELAKTMTNASNTGTSAGAIPLAKEKKTLFKLSSTADGNPSDDNNPDWFLQTNVPNANPSNFHDQLNYASGVTNDQKDGIFFIEKYDASKADFRKDAGYEFQINSTGVVSKTSNDYVVSTALPKYGNCQFLLINVVTAAGNRSWAAYQRSDDTEEDVFTFTKM